jgi:hypothetical protein
MYAMQQCLALQQSFMDNDSATAMRGADLVYTARTGMRDLQYLHIT